MTQPVSKLERYRQEEKYHVDAYRVNILDAAEKLFLQNGLDKTRMIDIAAQAGITKTSLYRYFPNRDVIALEIQARMLAKIAGQVIPPDFAAPLEKTRKIARSMIRNFAKLRDAYRYMGMFDSEYLDHSAGTALPQWTKAQLAAVGWFGEILDEISRETTQGNCFIMVLSTVI